MDPIELDQFIPPPIPWLRCFSCSYLLLPFIQEEITTSIIFITYYVTFKFKTLVFLRIYQNINSILSQFGIRKMAHMIGVRSTTHRENTETKNISECCSRVFVLLLSDVFMTIK